MLLAKTRPAKSVTDFSSLGTCTHAVSISLASISGSDMFVAINLVVDSIIAT